MVRTHTPLVRVLLRTSASLCVHFSAANTNIACQFVQAVQKCGVALTMLRSQTVIADSAKHTHREMVSTGSAHGVKKRRAHSVMLIDSKSLRPIESVKSNIFE